MRKFSKVAPVHHVSYAINLGEYEQVVDVSLVLRDLAKAFGSPLADVIHDFQWFTSGFQDDSDRLLCPSEFDVMVDLYDFVRYVNSGTIRSQDVQRAFVYINLNTGASVVWTHLVA